MVLLLSIRTKKDILRLLGNLLMGWESAFIFVRAISWLYGMYGDK